MRFQFAFEALEQGKGICCSARKPGENGVVEQAAHLAGITLHNRIAGRDLPVAADHHTTMTTHRKYRSALKLLQLPELIG